MPYLSKAGALKTIDDTWETNSILFLKCYLGITVSVPPVVSNTTNAQVRYSKYNLSFIKIKHPFLFAQKYKM